MHQAIAIWATLIFMVPTLLIADDVKGKAIAAFKQRAIRSLVLDASIQQQQQSIQAPGRAEVVTDGKFASGELSFKKQLGSYLVHLNAPEWDSATGNYKLRRTWEVVHSGKSTSYVINANDSILPIAIIDKKEAGTGNRLITVEPLAAIFFPLDEDFAFQRFDKFSYSHDDVDGTQVFSSEGCVIWLDATLGYLPVKIQKLIGKNVSAAYACEYNRTASTETPLLERVVGWKVEAFDRNGKAVFAQSVKVNTIKINDALTDADFDIPIVTGSIVKNKVSKINSQVRSDGSLKPLTTETLSAVIGGSVKTPAARVRVPPSLVVVVIVVGATTAYLLRRARSKK